MSNSGKWQLVMVAVAMVVGASLAGAALATGSRGQAARSGVDVPPGFKMIMSGLD